MRKKPTPIVVPLRLKLMAWPIYIGIGVAVFVVIYRVSGGQLPPPLKILPSDDPRRDAMTFGFLFGVLTALMASAFGQSVLVGIVRHRRAKEIAKNLLVDVARTGAETVIEAVIDGGTSSSATTDDGSSSRSSPRGGGRSGGGGGGAGW
jgi:uncharacterized membrane protein YgcG